MVSSSVFMMGGGLRVSHARDRGQRLLLIFFISEGHLGRYQEGGSAESGSGSARPQSEVRICPDGGGRLFCVSRFIPLSPSAHLPQRTLSEAPHAVATQRAHKHKHDKS